MKKLLFPFGLTVLVVIFFWQFFLKGLLPIPSDTIAGLYHPFRDYYAKEYPNGIPFKNFLVTDPVRQQYLWKNITTNIERNGKIPLWNPYTFSGTPLMANFQSGVFYPLNLIFFIFPFSYAWSMFIIIQPLFASLFMYFYLKNLGLEGKASFLGGFVFAFSGFSVAWLEWGNIIHTAIWLPLILLAIDKIISKNLKSKLVFSVIFVFSLVSAFFAGHLQIFMYVLGVSLIYFLARWMQLGKNYKNLTLFMFSILTAFILAFLQLIPTIRFILLSARGMDQNYLTTSGWFLPWQNLIQFVIPDYFGNPATLNYWGIWNYGEFVGFVGVGAFMLSILAIFRKDKKTLFFAGLFLVALIFALPTFFAKLPFSLNLPFISTSQPTRLMFIADFSLSILAALGLDYLIKIKNKRVILHVLLISSVLFIISWLSLIIFKTQIGENLIVVRQNLILPTILFILNAVLFLALLLTKDKRRYLIILIFIISLSVFDLFRFGWKFTPFTEAKYLFPQTKILDYLKENADNYRVMSTNPEILPPNFSMAYGIKVVEGYDPLYLNSYAQFVSAINRGKPDISAPFGFNRIVTVQNYDSEFIDLLGVKYLLTFDNLSNNNFIKIMQEGKTNLYLNKRVLPRTFFVKNVTSVSSNQEAIESLYKQKNNLKDNAVVVNFTNPQIKFDNTNGHARIINYSENEVVIETVNESTGFLVLTDNYYPTWHATIDQAVSKIYITDYNLRGLLVPKGKHIVRFYMTLL